MPKRIGLCLPLVIAVLTPSAWADTAGNPGALGIPGYTPLVPVSALARPFAGFDRSRFHITSSVSVGSGFGRGTEALQVMRLSYQFAAPLWMAVSVGNAWGPGAARSGRSFFLEGMDVAYRPHPSVLFQVQYRDLRSPLQLSPHGASPFSDYRWGP